jgi:hypothetical protein
MVTPDKINIQLEVDENCRSYIENARLKALILQASGLAHAGGDTV